MAAVGHTFPNYTQVMGTKGSGFTNLNGSTKLGALLIHSTSPAITFASIQSITTVTAFLANAGSPLTEEAGVGYSRQAIVSPTLTTSGLITTLSTTTPLSWTTSTISATYLLIFDFTTGTTIVSANDGTSVPLAYQDFGGTATDTAGTFTFTPASNVLATWTAS